MKTHKEESGMLKGFLRPILLGTFVGILGCIVVLLLLAATATTVDIPPALIVPLSSVASATGAFLGAIVAARTAGRNGWLVGLMTSTILILLLTAIGIGAFSPLDGGFLLIRTLIMLACGMVGGILAVNVRKRRKKR